MARTRPYPPSVDPGLPVERRLPTGWTRATFRDVLHIVERPVQLRDDELYTLVIAKRNRRGISLRGKLTGREILTKTQFQVHAGDFLMSRRQIIHGACGVVPEHLHGAVVSNEYVVVRTAPRLLMDYLQHFSHTPYFQRTCFHSSHGVDVEKMVFRVENWLNLPIHLPPLFEQRKIATILSSIGDAIERAKIVINQLQVVKKAIMQELLTFGVRGRKARLKSSEIGEIPEDWAVASYAELATDVPGSIQSGPFGSELKHSEFQNEGVLVIGIDNVLDSRFSFGSNHRISHKKFGELRRFQARPLDLLITVMATVGRCCVVPEDIETSIITKHVYRLSVDQTRANPYFLMYCLYGVERLAQAVRGSAQGLTRPGLNKSLLLPLLFPIPPLNEQREIVQSLQAVDNNIDAEQESAEHLRAVKSALMSRLLTGELRVTPDAPSPSPSAPDQDKLNSKPPAARDTP
jgi:type I restriction enzyme S subunit